jgi:hypothetical protein
MHFPVKDQKWDLALINLNYEKSQAFNINFNKRGNRITDQDDCYVNDYDFRFQTMEFELFNKRDFMQPFKCIKALCVFDD